MQHLKQRFFAFFIPYYYLRTADYPCLDVAQIRGHYAGSSLPSPLRHAPSFLFFIATRLQQQYFLLSSTRIALLLLFGASCSCCRLSLFSQR